MSGISKEVSQLLHPHNGIVRPFKEYEPFIQVEDPESRLVFAAALRVLYDKTADVWMPGSCYSANHLNTAAQTLKSEKRLGDFDSQVMTYLGGAHYFVTLDSPRLETPLVVDPFGVPSAGVGELEWMMNSRLILPFFGDAEQAPQRHQDVYAKAEAGYRAPFRP